MSKRRWLALLLVFGLVVAACGGSDTGTTATGDDTDTTDGGDGSLDPACEGETTEATDVGIAADTITVSVVADTGSPLAPGLFKGSVDAIKGWADHINDTGGLACRRIVVEEFDSALNANETKSAIQESCGSSLALVGTTALFVNDMSAAESCADSEGEATGLPDFAVLQTEAVHQCSPVSFAVIPGEGACPYAGEGERDFVVRQGVYQWYTDNFEDLHGVYLVPTDLPSTIASTMPGFRKQQEFIPADAEFGVSGRAPQSEYTPFVQAIKDNGSTFARCGAAVNCTIFLRQEARNQQVDTVQVWDCSLQCYDRRLIEEGAAAVNDTFVWLFFLPFEEADDNEELAEFITSVEETGGVPDGFGAQAWASAVLFEQVINEIVEADGVNGITRAKILEGLTGTEEFDANGMLATVDIGAKEPSPCFVLLQVQDGEFVRVEPSEPGTFNCEEDNLSPLTIDPNTEFKG